jgi:hypothetical protein
MQLSDLLSALQYDRSPNFLTAPRLDHEPDYGHIFRKAREKCGLHGVYTLRGSDYDKAATNVPVVYICEADTEERAREIHKSVWNQNIVPFLLIVGPQWIRLYRGFRYDPAAQATDQAVVTIREFNRLAPALSAFRADSIDNGRVWGDPQVEVTPKTRVDWKLLASLEELDRWLANSGLSDRSISHAIIGKFVYLHYLRQRRILSDAKLAEWGIDHLHVFSGAARFSSFLKLLEMVDDWLNGSVFPLPASKIRKLGADRLKKVAGVFQGETLLGQMHLDFEAYDFSLIPIETLSVIYEQFLHATRHSSGKSAGEARGAYYTPVPLVNYMLDRLESRRPLRPGMRVLDPACGSGAFLVQCYRKLIEQHVRQKPATRPRPTELRRLLVDHIFGLDTDEDACQITELSLILTLLEYVEPPDLTNTNFKLPVLRKNNIHCGNAFGGDADWLGSLFAEKFDWVVGNPPWIELTPGRLDSADEPVFNWMQRNREERPIGGNQVAEAFAWQASELVSDDGIVGLLLPAMTLYKYESQAFRKAFFRSVNVWSVANFANLADVLFGGRATLPASAIFYSAGWPTDGGADLLSKTVEVYSPFVANQPTARPTRTAQRRETWSIVVNASELAEIPYREILNGDALPWKLAMWGSPLDGRVLASVSRRFRTLGNLEDQGHLVLSEGLQLRTKAMAKREPTEHHPELAGKQTIDVKLLKGRPFLFRLPGEVFRPIPASRTYVRKRGGYERPLTVSRPPHVIVGAARNFAVYTNRFIAVPPRQIGIACGTGDQRLLKAIALYLNSDFATYHQFLTATEAGIEKSISTLSALRSLPVPFEPGPQLDRWEDFYSRVDAATRGRDDFNRDDLVKELNELSYDSLKLDARSRAAVEDLVRVRLSLTRGKMGDPAILAPSLDELVAYCATLRDELDAFLGDYPSACHIVHAIFDGDSGLVSVDSAQATVGPQPVHVWQATAAEAKEMATTRTHLVEQRSQWVYFNRNLRIYQGSKTFILKPMQRLHWTRTKAIQDAGEIIAETIQPGLQELERISD